MCYANGHFPRVILLIYERLLKEAYCKGVIELTNTTPRLSRGGKRILTKPIVVQTATSIAKLPVGMEIEIQQVDAEYRKVLVNNVWLSSEIIENSSKSFEKEAETHAAR